MSKKYLGVLVTVLLLGSSNVFAVDCEKASTTVELNECASITFKDADKRLNDAYKKLLTLLEPKEQKVLKDSESAWLKFRDKDAELQSVRYIGGTMYNQIFLSAKAELTDARTKELEGLMSSDPK